MSVGFERMLPHVTEDFGKRLMGELGGGKAVGMEAHGEESTGDVADLLVFAEAAALLQQATAIMAQWPATVPFDGPVFTWVWLAEAEEGRGNRKAAQEAFSTALTNLQDACDTGRLPEEMRAGVGDRLEERIARLEAVE